MSNQWNHKSQARAFAFKFMYQFQLPELKKLKEESQSKGIGFIEKNINEFESSYNEVDVEHPNNKISNEAKNFSKELIINALKNWNEIEELIVEHSKGWKLGNMDKVDLSILLIAISEMNYSLDQTHHTVIIDESIKLAKDFGTQKSYSFINAVLDSISKESA